MLLNHNFAILVVDRCIYPDAPGMWHTYTGEPRVCGFVREKAFPVVESHHRNPLSPHEIVSKDALEEDHDKQVRSCKASEPREAEPRQPNKAYKGP